MEAFKKMNASTSTSSPAGRRHRRGIQLDGLDQRAVPCGIPHGKSHPLPASRVEGNLEMVFSECRQIRHGDDLAVGFLAISPNNLGELERERPLDVGRNR